MASFEVMPLDIQIFNTLIIMLSEGRGLNVYGVSSRVRGRDDGRREFAGGDRCMRFSLSFLAMDLRMPGRSMAKPNRSVKIPGVIKAMPPIKIITPSTNS